MYRREDCPTPNKRQYKEKKHAEQSAFSIYRDRGYKLKPYHCVCGKWHLTSQRKERPFSDVSPQIDYWIDKELEGK